MRFPAPSGPVNRRPHGSPPIEGSGTGPASAGIDTAKLYTPQEKHHFCLDTGCLHTSIWGTMRRQSEKCSSKSDVRGCACAGGGSFWHPRSDRAVRHVGVYPRSGTFCSLIPCVRGPPSVTGSVRDEKQKHHGRLQRTVISFVAFRGSCPGNSGRDGRTRQQNHMGVSYERKNIPNVRGVFVRAARTLRMCQDHVQGDFRTIGRAGIRKWTSLRRNAVRRVI